MSLMEEVEVKIEKQFNQAVKEAEQLMRNKAPHPTGAKRGLGSESTGKLRASIRTEKLGKFRAFVGVTGIDYAKYAEEGRGAITKPYNMHFTTHGKEVYTRHVGPMRGWHFVKEAAALIRSKYGG